MTHGAYGVHTASAPLLPYGAMVSLSYPFPTGRRISNLPVVPGSPPRPRPGRAEISPAIHGETAQSRSTVAWPTGELVPICLWIAPVTGLRTIDRRKGSTSSKEVLEASAALLERGRGPQPVFPPSSFKMVDAACRLPNPFASTAHHPCPGAPRTVPRATHFRPARRSLSWKPHRPCSARRFGDSPSDPKSRARVLLLTSLPVSAAAPGRVR